MASTYPTTQDTFTTKANGGVISEDHINDLQNAVIAVEANVGTTNSAVATTIDYQLKNASSVNPGHKHTLAGALTDVEITSPLDGQGIVYETASGKFKNQTTSIADATTAVKGINLMSVAPVSAASPIAVGDNDPRVPTQNENDALVGTSGTAVSSSNKLVDADDVSSAGASGKIVRANGTALPALDGSALTNIPMGRLSQGILHFSYPGTATTPQGVTSESAGGTNYIYGVASVTGVQPQIYCYTLTNGLFVPTTRKDTTGFTGGAVGYIAVLGSYVYMSANNGGTQVLKRYDAVTLANETTMTVSGATNNGFIFTDGTDLYCDTGGGTGQFGRFTVSGTTITFVNNRTYTGWSSAYGNNFCDGTYVYRQNTTSEGQRFLRWALAGGASTLFNNLSGIQGVNSVGLFKISGQSNLSLTQVTTLGIQYTLNTPLV